MNNYFEMYFNRMFKKKNLLKVWFDSGSFWKKVFAVIGLFACYTSYVLFALFIVYKVSYWISVYIYSRY